MAAVANMFPHVTVAPGWPEEVLGSGYREQLLTDMLERARPLAARVLPAAGWASGPEPRWSRGPAAVLLPGHTAVEHSPGRGLYASVRAALPAARAVKKTRVYYRLPQSAPPRLAGGCWHTLSTQVAWWTPASHGVAGRNKCLCFFSALHTCPWGRMEWAWTSGGQGRCLEGLEAGGQVAPVVQEELFTSLEGGVELRGEAGHIGGHILENARWPGCSRPAGRAATPRRRVGGGKGTGGREAGGAAALLPARMANTNHTWAYRTVSLTGVTSQTP